MIFRPPPALFFQSNSSDSRAANRIITGRKITGVAAVLPSLARAFSLSLLGLLGWLASHLLVALKCAIRTKSSGPTLGRWCGCSRPQVPKFTLIDLQLGRSSWVKYRIFLVSHKSRLFFHKISDNVVNFGFYGLLVFFNFFKDYSNKFDEMILLVAKML